MATERAIVEAEFTAAMQGLARLVRGDRAGAALFPGTPEAAARSFWVVAVVEPLSFVRGWVAIEDDPILGGLDFGWWVFATLVKSCLLWTAVPLIVYQVTGLIDRRGAFFGYLAAGNWASIPITLVLLPFDLLQFAGAIDKDVGSTVSGIAFIPILVFLVFLTRTMLRVGTAMAIGIAAIEITAGMVIVVLYGGWLRAGVGF